MKQYIYALIALLLMLIAGLPSSAQFLNKTGDASLRAIRQGSSAVLLTTPGQIIDKTFVKALSGKLREEWAVNSHQLQMAQSFLQNPNTTELFPLPTTKTQTSTLTARVREAINRQEDLSALQAKINKTLYRWGQVLDNNNSLGYTQLAGVKGIGPRTATLSINGQTALIQDTPGHGFTIYPDEIHTNADVVDALIQTYANTPEILSQEKPENIAGWFYLRTNFVNALKEFQAAKEAYTTLNDHRGLFATWQKYHARRTEKGLLILRNYNYAAANLALHSANILQFMSSHPNIFPNAMRSYKQIMQLHNKNSGTPTNFQNFWNEALIPLI